MKITAKDLSRDEWEWLKKLSIGGAATLMLPAVMADRLKSLDLAEEKLGGTGISREGKRVIAEVIAARRVAGR